MVVFEPFGNRVLVMIGMGVLMIVVVVVEDGFGFGVRVKGTWVTERPPRPGGIVTLRKDIVMVTVMELEMTVVVMSAEARVATATRRALDSCIFDDVESGSVCKTTRATTYVHNISFAVLPALTS